MVVLHECLNRIIMWFNLWQMEISYDKCFYIRLGNSQICEHVYHFGDIPIKKCS
jgi:hypothetical protein